MSSVEKRWSVGIQLGIMVGAIALLFALIALVGGGFEARSTSFWIGVVSLVFALAVWFNIPIHIAATGGRQRTSFPHSFTAITFSTIYLSGVVLLAVGSAVTAISAEWLGALHLIWLFLFGAAMGINSLAGKSMDAMDEEDAQTQASRTNPSVNEE